ncbi:MULTISPECIES: Gfo/Idh/MocA family protein [unclassified Crossiella]|uniref:Gfo/Idh/MocA family protein n=1 Tax=unclassified Crossiella TaxID=2620835 RepID=UPI0020001DEC|nr:MULTISPECIES: Gfo/Idh/MocA family oxidoreductase [unclassified Crossiella]MCK2237642.1 Gfo/Idh/MocA family oxidoreductase [Crossiella sp. S99.2]MCK2254928.1 Gfo/Idh/MocA family oxidoreductase [Crossiella sp. S99.1]
MFPVDEQLKIGLVGAGPWARAVHAPGIADHPGTRLAAVWARRRDAAKDLAEPHGALTADSFDELLSTVDAVAFAVPPAVQGDLALQAARAGKHLVLEKPLAANVEQAQRLVDEVTDRGLASLLLLTRRYSPEVRDWLAGLHKLGGWTGGSVRWLTGAVLGGPYSASPWRQTDGAVLDIGPHAIDLLDAALGPVQEVIAAHRGPDDLCHLVLGHEGGASSTLTLSLRLPIQPSVVDIAVYGQHGHRALGSGEFSAQDCFTALLDEFLALIDCGRTEHPCDVRRGLHLQRVLDEIIQRAGWVA